MTAGGLQQIEIIIVLLAVVVALTAIARKLLLPYPILLVIGGLLLAMVPGLPVIRLDPDLVFLVFLPPILWAAAYFTSLREFRANLRPITLLALGLVLATTAAVAVVAHAVLPGLGWAAAIALGAIVSPPDAVAATAIARRLSVPRRIVAILEGESLVNDASALVLYRSAVAAAVSGTFILRDSLMDFVFAAAVGIGVGLLVGALTRWALASTDDSFSDIAITLLAPYVAWVLAETIHASAVLACVTGGIYVRQHFSEIVAPATRLQARAVWDVVVFVLNGVIFIMLGLQLGAIRTQAFDGDWASLLRAAVLVSATAIVVRLLWVPVAAWLPRILSAGLRQRDPMPEFRVLFLVGWTGMRGIVSLAAALALPLTAAAGTPFPFRTEIIVITFVVILSTLVLQGLSLPLFIRWLKLEADDGAVDEEQALARKHAAGAALTRLNALSAEGWAIPEQVDQLKVHYDRRVQRFASPDTHDSECSAEAGESFRRLRHETLSAERAAAIDLRDRGVIGDEVLHRIEHELDIEALRLGIGEARMTQGVSPPWTAPGKEPV